MSASLSLYIGGIVYVIRIVYMYRGWRRGYMYRGRRRGYMYRGRRRGYMYRGGGGATCIGVEEGLHV